MLTIDPLAPKLNRVVLNVIFGCIAIAVVAVTAWKGEVEVDGSGLIPASIQRFSPQ